MIVSLLEFHPVGRSSKPGRAKTFTSPFWWFRNAVVCHLLRQSQCTSWDLLFFFLLFSSDLAKRSSSTNVEVLRVLAVWFAIAKLMREQYVYRIKKRTEVLVAVQQHSIP